MSEQNKKGWAEDGPDSDGEDIQRCDRTRGGDAPRSASVPQHYEGRTEKRDRSIAEKEADINPLGPFTVNIIVFGSTLLIIR
jgi:hypothetical protein